MSDHVMMHRLQGDWLDDDGRIKAALDEFRQLFAEAWPAAVEKADPDGKWIPRGRE